MIIIKVKLHYHSLALIIITFARWRGKTCSSSDYDRIEMIIRLLSQGGNVFHIILHCREYSGFTTQ